MGEKRVFKDEGDVRSYLIAAIGPVYVLLAIIGSLASALRILDTGWLPLYGFHFLLAVLTLVVFLGPARITPENLRLMFAVLAPAAIGIPALSTLGFYSNGVIWLMISYAMAGIFLNRRISLTIALLELLAIALVAWLFIGNRLRLPIDANHYIHAPSGWLSLIFGTVIGVYILLSVVIGYRESVRTLMNTIEEQRDQIRHQANHDPLTGLPTIRLARDRLEMACERGARDAERVAVLFVDLDGFKSINDRFGHEAGDEILRTIGERLAASIRSVDTAARQGGDEFIVILEGVTTDSDACRLAEKLVARIADPIPYLAENLHIGASIGVALYPEHGTTAGELLRHADEAMYAVKRSGKNGFALYASLPSTV